MKDYLFSPQKKFQYLLCIGDFAILFLVLVLSYALRIYINSGPDIDQFLSKIDPFLILIILTHIFVLYVLDLYNLDLLPNRHQRFLKIGAGVLMAGLILSGMLFFFPKYVFGRQVLLIHLVIAFISLYKWRSFFLKKVLKNGPLQRLVVIGGDNLLPALKKELANATHLGYELVHHYQLDIDETTPLNPKSSCSFKQYLEKLESVPNIDVIAFDSTHNLLSKDDIKHIIDLKFKGIAIFDLTAFYKNITGKVPLTCIDERWLFNSRTFQGRENEIYKRLKRCIEVFFSLMLLLLTIPLFLLVAALIKLSSKGPIFFVQERLGLNKSPFNCIKFRTMINNAEKATGPVWSNGKDTRITKVGRFLRKTRLDELPQLINILRGEISFVGPRPIREHFATLLREKVPFYDLRFSTKPGLTGWAQVNIGYPDTMEGQIEKFQYELFYIQNMSIFWDLLILIETVRTVFKREGH